MNSTRIKITLLILLVFILYPFLPTLCEPSIVIDNVQPIFPVVGEEITFWGRVHNMLSPDRIIGIEDPISEVCTKTMVDSDGNFMYTTHPSSKVGIFDFVFGFSSGNKAIKEIFVLSIAPSSTPELPFMLAYSEKIDISQGQQGSEIDEETNALTIRIPKGWLGAIDFTKMGSFLRDVVNTASDIGGTILTNISRSPTAITILVATGVFCIGSMGTACGVMIPIAVTTVAKETISSDVEVALKHINGLDESSKKEILNALNLSLTLSSIYEVVNGADPSGEFLIQSIPQISGVVGKLTEYNIRETIIDDFQKKPDGSLSSMVLQVITEDGSCFTYRLQSFDAFQEQDKSYLNINILLKSGKTILGKIVIGELGGTIYGARTELTPSYFTIVDAQGVFKEIPKTEMESAHIESLIVTQTHHQSIFGVLLNRGKEHQIKRGAVYSIYRTIPDILGIREKTFIGRLQIINVLEDTSIGAVIQHQPGYSIKPGDYCE